MKGGESEGRPWGSTRVRQEAMPCQERPSSVLDAESCRNPPGPRAAVRTGPRMASLLVALWHASRRVSQRVVLLRGGRWVTLQGGFHLRRVKRQGVGGGVPSGVSLSTGTITLPKAVFLLPPWAWSSKDGGTSDRQATLELRPLFAEDPVSC